MSFASFGVSAPFLRSFKARVPAEYTTKDVCDKIIIPETDSLKCAFVDLLKGTNDENGRPLIGQATVFVSHAWKFKFSSSFEVMMDYAESNPDAYFWFDLFVNNQNVAANLPQEWWSTTFKR